MALPLVLDTDIGTDVDDALALAFALRHPGIDLRAVTTVSGDTRRRARLAAALLALAGRCDVEVAAGLAVPPPEGRAVEGGHEGDDLRLVEQAAGSAPALSPRTAVDVLVGEGARGAAAGAPVTVAAVGMQTNVAAAVDADAGFASNLARLAVMGGAFPSAGFDAADEHNLNADPAGALRALGAGAPLLLVPTDVTVRTYLLGSHVDRLRRGDALCRALAGLVDGWAPVLRDRGRPLRDAQVAALHDPLAVACLVEPGFVTVERLPVRVAVEDGLVTSTVDPVAGRDADVVTDVDADGFVDYWLEVVTGAGPPAPRRC